MARRQSFTALFACTIAAAMWTGCSSSRTPTAPAPPEPPETSPPATAPQPESASHGAGSGTGAEHGGGQAAGEGQTGATGSAGETSVAGGQPGAGKRPEGAPSTVDEATAALEAELGKAAGELDAKMLEEMRRLAAESAARQGGEGPQSSPSGGAGTAGPSGEERTRDGRDSGGVGGGGAGGEDDGRVPPDVGDGSDDDIVARQLREAAMAENDPALRDKLWNEYRRYKASVSKSSKEDS